MANTKLNTAKPHAMLAARPLPHSIAARNPIDIETKTNTMTRMRAIEAAIVRAQCAANPGGLAGKIVCAKIEAELNATAPDDETRQRDFEQWDIKLNTARSVAEIMIIESRAAASYWRAFRDAELRERKNGNLPRSWLRFAQRNKGAAFLGNQHASVRPRFPRAILRKPRIGLREFIARIIAQGIARPSTIPEGEVIARQAHYEDWRTMHWSGAAGGGH